MSGYQISTYLPGSSCPSCTCVQGVVCSVLPCHGPCSTGSLSYTTDPCAPPGCWGCSCHPVTAPCRTVTGCTGACEGGTLGITTVEGCFTRCPEYCGCKSTTEFGSPAMLTTTPTISALQQTMTGVVMAVRAQKEGSRVEKRGLAFEPVVTTVVL